MTKRHGYSLSIDDERSLVLKIVTGDERPYRLEFADGVNEEHTDVLDHLDELTRPRSRVVLNLPNDEVHLLNAQLPSLAPRVLAGAVQGVVTRKEGGSPGDWITQHTRLPAEPGHHPGMGDDYAIVFVKHELVASMFEAAVEVGCRPVGMLPDFLALEDLFRRHGPDNLEDGPWLLVHLGKTERFLLVGDDDSLLFARPLPENLSGEGEQSDYLERLVTEVERSGFFAQQAERSMVVRNIVVCGQPDLADELVDALVEKSEASIRRWRPEDLFETGAGELAWPLTLHLGRAVAAMHGPRRELLPPGAKASPVRLVRRKVGIALAAFVTGAVSMLLVGGVLTSRVQQEYLREADDRIDQLYQLASRASADYLQNRALQARQENVDRLGRGEPRLDRVLDDLAERTPRDIIFGGLELERDHQQRMRLVLRGESFARTGDEAQEIFLGFLADLGRSDHLVELKEPVFLEIAGVSESRKPQSRVTFTLEYLVRAEVSP